MSHALLYVVWSLTQLLEATSLAIFMLIQFRRFLGPKKRRFSPHLKDLQGGPTFLHHAAAPPHHQLRKHQQSRPKSCALAESSWERSSVAKVHDICVYFDGIKPQTSQTRELFSSNPSERVRVIKKIRIHQNRRINTLMNTQHDRLEFLEDSNFYQHDI